MHPQMAVRGATLALSRRTTLRKAFLAPWHPDVGLLWLYCLAHAQSLTGVPIHHACLMPNHTHLTLSSPSYLGISEFLWRLHRDFSCALQQLLTQCHFDTPAQLFDSRATHRMRLLDVHAQAQHLLYERLNPVAAGLVASPNDMPLPKLDFDLYLQGPIEVPRPNLSYLQHRPETLLLHLTAPAQLYRAFEGDLQRLVTYLQQLEQEALVALQQERTRPVLGAERVRAIHPWDEPSTPRPSGAHRVVPSFKVGMRGKEGRERRVKAALGVRQFRARHRQSWLEEQARKPCVVYPSGTYAARVQRGMPTAPEPPCNGAVDAPEPLLEEVREELQASGVLGGKADDKTQAALVAYVREQLAEDVAALVERAQSELGGMGRRQEDEAAEEQDAAGQQQAVQERGQPQWWRTDGEAGQVVVARVVRLRGQRWRGAGNKGHRKRTRHFGVDPPE